MKAKNYLFQAIDRSILETILNKETTKGISDSLKRKYQGTARVQRAQREVLQKEYEMLSMNEGETVNEYFARGGRASTKGYLWRIFKRKGTRSRRNARTRRVAGRRRFDKSIVECYHCHKLGHFQYECPSKDSDAKANYIESNEEMLLIAYASDSKISSEEFWFLDSGCGNHMCGKKEYFIDFDENFTDMVKLGNNASLVVTRKGNVRLQVDGMVQVITRVFYMPELKNNLLSIGQLQEKGLAILFQHDRCKVYHSEKGLIMDTRWLQIECSSCVW
ncbi:hypothetical protein Salat_0674900 [Sesamum alatum]|uniref:CCHC-type domain-containing protein n=1 Tax=Sesamum alatum TaxID=300844 RepID=A0AAE1YRY4_9LAMI|nr:hypothetical protein Salat_0674900 [Sesamum alatum]